MAYLQATDNPDILEPFDPSPSPDSDDRDDGLQLRLFPNLQIVLDEDPPTEMTGMYYLG